MRGPRVRLAAAAAAVALTAPGLLSGTAGPATASTAVAPWPEMRHDIRNSGSSAIAGRYYGDRPWAYRTGRGIFSTPVIGSDGSVYVGSADHNFYAFSARGRMRWRLRTGGIIDAAAALSPASSGAPGGALTFGSGDELLYHLALPRRGAPRVLWRFRANKPPVGGQQVDWWEGNVAVGPDGNLYAGNTGGTAYSLNPQGRLRWTFTAGQSIWTTPAFGAGGASYWGSLDLHVYRLDAAGQKVWSAFSPGYVISSPALGSDGAVYAGSFDSHLYALDPATGAVRWSFPTSDHVYASPALGSDAAGHTDRVYIASADGSVYALTTAGRLLWRYDTGDPVRSSPALGRAPASEHRDILYVGSSNGKLYALNADTGRRRWSFDTTPRQPALRDRNDLNASPALGRTGVVIAGEHGYVDYVPYDYCLHRRDPRCSTDPRQELGEEVDRVFPVSAGGTTMRTSRLRGISPATVLNLRLIVRHRGRTVNAAVLDPAHVIVASPRFAFTVQESGDGHFLYVLPRALLRPGTTYRITLRGRYTDNGSHMGNFDPRGPAAGSFRTTLTLQTRRAGRLPLRLGARQVSAMIIRRLAVPMPAFLPSVNQIGFDSYDWIASTFARRGGRLLMWVIGAYRDARGVERVDPQSAFAFPLSGSFAGSSLALSTAGVPLQFSFGEVPLSDFRIRGELGRTSSFLPGVSLYGATVCADVPHYGAALKFTGICNPQGVLAASGTLLSDPYRGPAARWPQGVRLGSLTLGRRSSTGPGEVTARLIGSGRPGRGHVAALVLVDDRREQPVSLDYRSLITLGRDRSGRISTVRLALPAGTSLPARVRAYVMVDAFPLGSRLLAAQAADRPAR